MQSRFSGWSAQVLDAEDVTAVMRDVGRYGFAIVRDQWRFDASDFNKMSARYYLGPIYQSDFNRRLHADGMSPSGINQVGGLTTGAHDVFNSTSSAALHTDGSYLPIGTIKTSILLCKQHALRGGESILFDSVSAFQTLAHHHPDLAQCLLAPKAFRRRSTDPRLDRQYEHVGPVFLAEEDGAMVGGFTLDVTADWDYSRRTDPRVLDAAAYLTRLTKPDSGYIVSFPLRKGQALIMRNDQLSHGRSAYIEDPRNPRILLRGLFRSAPGACAVQIRSAPGSKDPDSRSRSNG
ncbi:clavaminate synthase [Xanthomonas oryzae]|uniref:TauD/TfdA family dioxygenase n=1 Tax=Xanthomonas oryzae TaxID=347 RepID=UPI0009EAF9FB|nr:TauD/TfdA family dioxygenase [Xanthomonas oryzae]QBG90551.1 clavaminate synthase [Xanthomonas oryzae]QBG94436.1 clavaminate synthase [Xanthomonas oryzae]QBH05398.1 clavaminate synthase [Xanthomonas oryzae]UNE62575.1 TauD/TfdA family dioxygenase [Xanthomonas oryzae]